jgi:hypothetical protein
MPLEAIAASFAIFGLYIAGVVALFRRTGQDRRWMFLFVGLCFISWIVFPAWLAWVRWPRVEGGEREHERERA